MPLPNSSKMAKERGVAFCMINCVSFNSTINVDSPDYPPIVEQQRTALSLRERYPGRVAFAATFSVADFQAPDWGERTVSIRAEDPTTLRTNMTFHLIAGMWLRGMGFEVSESIRVTDHGHETFSSVPRGLISLDSRR